MKDFFKDKVGSYPYQYQLKVMEVLLSGKNVILSVPTGAGKTWASTMPFLYAQINPEIHFPKKMIYSLPLRTLANSIYEDVSEVAENTSIQTGEYSDDPYFENDIIFSTIDQTLSNFLCFPLPLSPRLANINAGALIGSYLVFDEFHLLDEKRSMATTIGMLKTLGNLSRCCIMTATLSDGFMLKLKEALGGDNGYEIITLDNFPDDKAAIGSLKPNTNKKRIAVVASKLTASSIIEQHKQRTIVICNRVETAQNIYFQLQQQQQNGSLQNTKLICLHSRFFEKDRKHKEALLKNYFGKESNSESVILVATQVIEAGMDISCDVMHTEISPISSFLQRAGRCARFSDQTGEIFIYDVLEPAEREKIIVEAVSKEDKEEIRKLNNKYLPYDASDCKKTLDELAKYTTLDGVIPKQLVEGILGKTELEVIDRMKSGKSEFNYDKIKKSWSQCQKNNYRDTIRDIQSLEIILITDNMSAEICKYPYRYQSLSMYKWSLISWLTKIQQSEGFDRDDWLIKRLEENTFIGEIDNDEDINFQLMEIADFKSLPSQVYVNASYFGYHPDFGFNWEYENTFGEISPKRELNQKTEDFKPLTKDTFFQHNMGLIGAFEKEFLGEEKRKLNFVFTELAKYIESDELTRDDFIQLVHLMILFHDYGKLNEAWQAPMQKYQAQKDPNWIKEVLAHTDFNAKDENDITLSKSSGLGKRPAHAGVGAYIVQEVIPELFNENNYLKSSISMAVSRHHSPLSTSYPVFEISNSSYNAMNQLLEKFGFDIEILKEKKYNGEIDGFEYDGAEEYLLYFFFVRILRLCDQKATEDFNKYYSK